MKYLEDSYIREFDATVIDVQDGTAVLLDRTYVYPLSGGQPADTGVLRRKADAEEFRIVGVKTSERGLVHEVDRGGLCPGDAVLALIDWERRYKLMRSHTAAHIVSTIINRETGALITGNQLDLDKVRIDFSLEQFDAERFKGYIEKANALIAEGRAVTTKTLPRHEAVLIPSLSKLAAGLPEWILEVRVVTIHGLDEQACGGTHVKNTSEIGRLSFLKAENKGQKNRRVYFTLAD